MASPPGSANSRNVAATVDARSKQIVDRAVVIRHFHRRRAAERERAVAHLERRHADAALQVFVRVKRLGLGSAGPSGTPRRQVIRAAAGTDRCAALGRGTRAPARRRRARPPHCRCPTSRSRQAEPADSHRRVRHRRATRRRTAGRPPPIATGTASNTQSRETATRCRRIATRPGLRDAGRPPEAIPPPERRGCPDAARRCADARSTRAGSRRPRKARRRRADATRDRRPPAHG